MLKRLSNNGNVGGRPRYAAGDTPDFAAKRERDGEPMAPAHEAAAANGDMAAWDWAVLVWVEKVRNESVG